jgi:glycosyltransferase involved in cell wall biosynthesis
MRIVARRRHPERRDMRIAIAAHLLEYPRARQSGVGTYVRNLLRTLPDVGQGEQFDIFWGRDGEPPSQDLTAAANVTHHFSRLDLRSRALRVPYEHVVLPRSVRKAAPQVLHLPDPSVSLLSPATRTVVTVHDLTTMLYPETYGNWRARYKSAVIRAAVRRARMVITVSESTKRDVTRLLDVDPENIVTVSEGVAPEFRELVDPEAARARLGLPEHFLLSVSRLDPRKNLVRLFEAYALARRTYDVTTPLYVVGAPGWLHHEILSAPTRLGIAEHVTFTSYLPLADVVAMYGTADALIYPALYEGFGLPVLEAMACGTPVVTSNVSSLPEVAGAAALLVDPLDTADLAKAIGRISGDEELRQTLRRAGLRRASDFTWERTARATLDVYARAIA